MSVSYRSLLRHRTLWLGFAMVWIAWAHSGFKPGSLLFSWLKSWGYGGVDLCLFASGIGCYFSLDKDPDQLRFLKRRIARLAPAYLPFILGWSLCRHLQKPLPLPAFIGNFFGIQHLTNLGNSLNWYISALVLFYLLSPLFKDLTDRLGKQGQALTLGLVLLLTVPFWQADNCIIIVTRIPIYLFGMFFARSCKDGAVLTGKKLAAYLTAMTLGIGVLSFCQSRYEPILWSYGLHWYPLLLITPGLCILLSLGARLLEKVPWSKVLTKPLEVIGANSFEVYLIHVPLFEYLYPRLRELPYDRNLLWLGVLPVTALAVAALKLVSKGVEKILFSREVRV